MQSQIPTLEEEKPVTSMKGFIFVNPAWHARLDDLWPPKAGEAPATGIQRQSIDLYLANFCRPVKSIAQEVRCIACNNDLTTPYGKGAKTGFHTTHLKINRNTPTHEARCGGCGYPIRCRHVMFYIGTQTPVVKLDFFPMCYHPMATEGGLRLQ